MSPTTGPSHESGSLDPNRHVRVDRRLRQALESGSLPHDLLICGPAGTGKTYGVLEVLHCLACDYPNLRILICRATRASLTESALVTYEQEILPADGAERIAVNCLRRVRQSYEYPSGSEIVVGGMDRPSKILSTSWDVIYPNEAIEFTEEAWESLASRLRRPGRDPRFGFLLGDTNPGDPSHWLRQRALAGRTVLWDTSHQANPRLHNGRKWTAEGLAYLEQLGHLTGSRRKRLLDGLWAAGEGAWFDGFDPSTHVSASAEYDPAFPVHVAVDSGVYSGVVWFQLRPPGVCVFGDYLSFSRPAHQVAGDIVGRSHELCGGRMDRRSTDPAGKAATAIGPTVLEEYRRGGFRPECWPVRSVLDSLALVESFVSVDPPELLIHPRCGHLIDAFANYKRARTSKGQWLERPEDPQHPYEDLIDSLKGGLCAAFPDGRKSPAKLFYRKPGRIF